MFSSLHLKQLTQEIVFSFLKCCSSFLLILWKIRLLQAHPLVFSTVKGNWNPGCGLIGVTGICPRQRVGDLTALGRQLSGNNPETPSSQPRVGACRRSDSSSSTPLRSGSGAFGSEGSAASGWDSDLKKGFQHSPCQA